MSCSGNAAPTNGERGRERKKGNELTVRETDLVSGLSSSSSSLVLLLEQVILQNDDDVGS